MANEKITIGDIELASNIEYKIMLEGYKHNGVLFEHSFDHDKTLLAQVNGECYYNGTKVPYLLWHNLMLKYVHFRFYSHTLVDSKTVSELHGSGI